MLSSPRLAASALAVTLALTACGSSDPADQGDALTDEDAAARCLPDAVDCDDTPGDTGADDTGSDAYGTRPADGEPGSMAMCIESQPDCNDMVVGEDAIGGGSGGDAMMEPDIHIIDELSAATRVVEQSPGSVADAYPLFLAEAVVDGATITVTFSGGEAPCFVVDHAEVVEDDARVVVLVYAGPADPDAEGCDMQEVSSQAVTVELSAELGDRALLDGSRLAPDDAQN